MRVSRLVVLTAAPLMALASMAPATAAPAGPADPVRPSPVAGSAVTDLPRASQSEGHAIGRQALDAVAHGSARAAARTVRLVARLAAGSATPTVRSRVRALGLTPASGLAKLGYLTVSVPAADVAAERARLAATPGIASVAVAAPRTPFAAPTDPLYSSSQATMYNAVKAPAAWSVATGSGVTIAILDGGFDVTHPDLASKITSHWDVVANNDDVSDAPGSGDVAGHGTATASVAAAATNNGLGIAGSAWDASLMLIQVADATGGLDSANSASGILYATDHGANVISMSYGGSSLDPVEAAAVAYAVAHGVVVVAAAGNNASTAKMYPAADAGVIAVGATTNNGSGMASFSEYGTWVDVAAPGTNIPVALPLAADIQDGNQDGYGIWHGTSFSAPMVAGEAALMLAEHPTIAPGRIAALISSTALTTPTGWARGLVQFGPAVAAAGAIADTVLTAPTDGSTVSGGIAVSATSGMPSVRFDLVGTPASVTLPVVSGVASGTLPSWGLDGAQTVRARGCDATTCGQPGPGGTAGVTVSNAAPVLTSPVDGDSVGVSFVASATATGGAVRFYADGITPLALDAAAPYSMAIDTAALADGVHSITAVSCTPTGAQCDLGHPSNSASITVTRLRPTVKVVPNPFSPNADTRRDTTVATITLEQPQDVKLRVYGPTGLLVRGPVSFGLKGIGAFTWIWDGKSNSKLVVGDGTYRVEVATSAVVNAGTIDEKTVLGLASTTVRSDRTKAALTAIVPSVRTFYPVKDAFYDTVLLGATSNEAVSSMTVYVRNSAGTKVRALTASAKPAGRVAVSWDGRNTSKVLLPAGTYRFQVLVSDLAGNLTLSSIGYVTLSLKKLVKKSATATLAPLTSTRSWYAGACSKLFRDVRAGWPYSLGYRSGYVCGSTLGDSDVVISQHSFTLPAATRYSAVRVTATSGSHTSFPDTASLIYYDSTGSLSDTAGVTLGYADGTYSGPSVATSQFLWHGREIWWLVGTTGTSYYDVWQFHVVWTYYVLA